MPERSTFKTLLKNAFIAWLINGGFWLASLFARSYTKSNSHWSHDAWHNIVFVTTTTKMVLTFAFIGALIAWLSAIYDEVHK